VSVESTFRAFDEQRNWAKPVMIDYILNDLRHGSLVRRASVALSACSDSSDGFTPIVASNWRLACTSMVDSPIVDLGGGLFSVTARGVDSLGRSPRFHPGVRVDVEAQW